MIGERRKLIEVALPLEAINKASAREKSIRHGHPSTLHLWWARRPLAACRAVIFTSLVDDPGDPELTEGAAPPPPAYIEACKRLPLGKNAAEHDTPRRRLFDFIERLVLWESTNDEQVLSTARELIRLSTGGNPPPLLDPFAGGGSIPLEAQRLGLEAHASDLNPVAVMINKALIEIPPKFANRPPVNPRDKGKGIADKGEGKRGEQTGGAGLFEMSWEGAAGLASDVRYYGQWMREKAWERIGHLYPKYVLPDGAPGETVIAWLWARTVTCPNPACGAQMPLVRSFDLSRKKGHRAWVEPKVDAVSSDIRFEVCTGSGRGPTGTVNRQGARCLACGTPVPFDHIREEGKADRMGAQLMAVVTEGTKGRSYHEPTHEHASTADVSIPDSAPTTDLPEKALGFRVQLYGMTQHRDLFTPRQLVALTTFSDLVGEARAQIAADAREAGLPDGDVPLRDGGTGARAYAEAVSVYLACAVDRVADYSSTISVWSRTRDQLIHTFTRQALPMVWDYPEVNVFAGAAGDLFEATKSVSRVISSLSTPAYVRQEDAKRLPGAVRSLICTDPPYYDNIGYADLSDYFYVWMRRSLTSVYPDVFTTMLVPKEPELIATPYRFDGSRDAANQHFENGLKQAFRGLNTIVASEFPLTVFYAFKQSGLVASEGVASTGWETMLEGLVDAQFTIDGTWPVRTERPSGVKTSVNALASSIVLVCRPRPGDAPMTSRREFVTALRNEVPQALREMQSGNIAPVDLAQASIGPGMAVYSRYSKVLEPSGDRLTVRTALQLINRVLDEYLTEQEGALDEASRFAVAWFEQNGFREGAFGSADVLARAKNTSVDTLAHTGLLSSGAGKVRLLKWDELDEGFDPDPAITVWEAAHRLIRALNTDGEAGVAALLAALDAETAAEARQLAYRLYSICERKGWSEPARDYNGLVVSWGAGQEQARELREQVQQGMLPGMG